MDRFAQQNKTHLGNQCQCDWMRRFDGFCHDKKCDSAGPHKLNKSMSILQMPEGIQALLDALALVEKILLPYCMDDGQNKNLFAPVVGLFTERDERVYTKEGVTRAMNNVYEKSGSRCFYRFKTTRGFTRADFIDEHWDTIEGSTCKHCDNLPTSQVGRYDRNSRSMKWKAKAIARIQYNCSNVYRPLKAAMERELQFVRYNPRPNKYAPKYQGMVAGISNSGVFCGMYIVNGLLEW